MGSGVTGQGTGRADARSLYAPLKYSASACSDSHAHSLVFRHAAERTPETVALVTRPFLFDRAMPFGFKKALLKLSLFEDGVMGGKMRRTSLTISLFTF